MDAIEMRGRVKMASAAPPINTEAQPYERWGDGRATASQKAEELGWQPTVIAGLTKPCVIHDPLFEQGKVGQVQVWIRQMGMVVLVRFVFLTEGDGEHNPVQEALAAQTKEPTGKASPV